MRAWLKFQIIKTFYEQVMWASKFDLITLFNTIEQKVCSNIAESSQVLKDTNWALTGHSRFEVNFETTCGV